MDAKAFIVDDRIRITWATGNSSLFYDALGTVKSLPDRQYRKKPYIHWFVPATPHNARAVIRLLEPIGFDVHKEVHDMAITVGGSFDKLPLKAGGHIEGLYDYQYECIDWVLAHGGRGIIADGVGLGKSVEAIGAIAKMTDDIGRVLVVAPANVVYKWGEREVEKWTDWSYQVIGSSKDKLKNVFVHIVSYDVMKLMLPELLGMNYHMIVLDEFHYIKNNQAQRTRAAKLLVAGVPYLLGLSGTPLLNRPIELFNILHLLDSKTWANRWAYGHKYCGGKTEFGQFTGASNLKELQERLKPYMIRRLKREVQADLPPLTVTILPVVADLKEYREVARNVEAAILALSPTSKGYWINVLDRMNMLRKSIGMAKRPVALQWAKDFLEQQEPNVKLLIYAHHRDVVESLANTLRKYGCLTITGDVPARKREDNARMFREDSEHRVMIISQAGGVGQDLFGENDNDCSNILFAELEWRPADFEQAWGRLDRTGQTLPVNAWILQAKSTIDTYIARLVEQKEDVIEQVVGETPGVIREIIHDWQQKV